MKIETNLATLVAGGLVIFIGGEIIGYYKCRENVLKTMVNNNRN